MKTFQYCFDICAKCSKPENIEFANKPQERKRKGHDWG